jgi:hypothetical protein
MFHVNHGIIGAAFGKSQVLHTRRYDTLDALHAAIAEDMRRTRQTGKPEEQRKSWLAIPFLGPDGEPVLVLYADTFEFNFFADDTRTSAVVDMCWGFSRLIDELERRPFPNLRNFPFEPGVKVKGSDTLYRSVQKERPELRVPQFERVRSFNFESSAA